MGKNRLSEARFIRAISFITAFITALLWTTVVTAADTASAANPSVILAAFSQGSPQGWEEKSFDGKTLYSVVTDPASKQKALRAESRNSASGLFREVRIDLEKTPWLHWSWRAEDLYADIDENKKSGDDFAARIYVVIDGGLFFWNTRALNYVWSASHRQGESWPNPFTANATMFAIESGPEKLGQWRSYKRNVREDLKRLVGKDVQYIDAVAIMTDSDNGGQKATTYYGDIFFTAE